MQQEVDVWWNDEISEQDIVESFKANEGVKLNNANYCDIAILNEWYNDIFAVSKSGEFMYDNAPSNVANVTIHLLEHKRFTGEKIMEWQP